MPSATTTLCVPAQAETGTITAADWNAFQRCSQGLSENTCDSSAIFRVLVAMGCTDECQSDIVRYQKRSSQCELSKATAETCGTALVPCTNATAAPNGSLQVLDDIRREVVATGLPRQAFS